MSYPSCDHSNPLSLAWQDQLTLIDQDYNQQLPTRWDDHANGGTVPDAMIQPPGGADPEAPQ